MSKRLVKWVNEYKDEMEEHEIAAALGNGEIRCPEWVSYSPCTAVGFALWDNEESDGSHNLYCLNAEQPEDY